MIQNPMVHIDDDDRIECEHVVHAGHPEGYFVLRFTPKGARRHEQSLTLDLTLDRLERLHAAIGARLAAVDPPAADPAPTGGHAARAWTRDCGNCDPGGVVAAEAATGGALDYDDLLESAMAAGFGPRGEDFDDPTDAEIAAGVRNAPKDGF